MNLKTILNTLLLNLILLFSACSNSHNTEKETVIAVSQESVTLASPKADSYSWTQISGESVIIIDANKRSMSFIAPNVDTEIELLFEVEYLVSSLVGEDTINKHRVRVIVIVKPLEETPNAEANTTLPSDKNVTTPSGTDTTLPTTTNPLKSIVLTISNTSLNIDTNTSLNAVATYEDKTTKDITDEVEWISTDLNAVQISKHQLKAKKEKNITLRAKLGAITSNAVAVEIYQNINGHRLPPEPNKTLNDSTLLGIDVNGNGVRDDVERKIYFTYDKKINQKLMMQSVKRHQSMLADPDLIKNAYNWTEASNKDSGCKYYLFDKYDIPFIKNSVDFFEDNTYNSEERIRKYMKYNQALSGGVFGTPASAEVEASCDFNVTEALGF